MAGARAIRVGIAGASATTGVGVHATALVRTRLTAFCAALERMWEQPVEPVLRADYATLSRDVAGASVDIAWLPPVLALRALRDVRLMPVLTPVRNGRADFHTALFTRQDGLSSLEAGQRLSVAWVDRLSASGYQVIKAALCARGLEAAIGDEHFLGSHAEVSRAVASRRVDVGATFVHRSAGGQLERAGWGRETMRVLLEQGPIPGDVVVASLDLPGVHISALRRALVEGSSPALLSAAQELLEAEAFVVADRQRLADLAGLTAFLRD